MGAVLWFDECMLRYTDEEIVGTLATTPYWRRWNGVQALNPNRSQEVITGLLDDLRSKAVNSSSARKVASGRMADPDIQTVYALVQCTPDLHPDDCDTCLVRAAEQLQQFCDRMTGCSVFLPSCFLRHETYLFYNESKLESLVAPTPEPSPVVMPPPVFRAGPDAPQSPPEGKSGINITRVILPVVVSVIVCLMIVVLIGIWLICRRKPSSIEIPENEVVKLMSTSGEEIPTSQNPSNPRADHIRTSEPRTENLSIPNGQLQTIAENYTFQSQQNPPKSIGQHETTVMQYKYGDIETATESFSDANKLGKGAFGAVYQGVLKGRAIAAKKLSMESTQGDKEFKNEVSCLSQLQHRNLVKLLGFSMHGKERLLVYEFVPKGSLNRLIFDPTTKPLDWSERSRIIQGIAKGLMYLHEDSPVTMIHLDLKASNILLEEGMNPKIADFGLARLFGEDKTHGSTKNNAGTRGYMSPEYAMHGKFSFKCDVFSFGVLVLEIINGRRRNCMTSEENAMDLVSYALKKWGEGEKLDIVDIFLKSSSSGSMDDILKCINIGLLCVEEKVADRPTMAEVCGKLSNLKNVILHDPSEATSNYWLDPRNSTYIQPQSDDQDASKNTFTKNDELSGR